MRKERRPVIYISNALNLPQIEDRAKLFDSALPAAPIDLLGLLLRRAARILLP